MRIYALYGTNRKVKLALLATLIVTVVPMLAVAVIIIHYECGVVVQGAHYYSLNLLLLNRLDKFLNRPICVARHSTRNHLIFWIPALLNETFLFVLAAYKGLKMFHERRDLAFANRLELFLIKGSVLYFFV